MAVEVIAKLKPKNNADFPLMDAKDIEVDSSGKRLNEVLEEPKPYPIEEFKSGQILPDRFYTFGVVDSLEVVLEEEPNDGLAHEYMFEFTASDSFIGFEVSPAPRWVTDPDVSQGKTYQVSIVRGLGVIAGA